MFVRESDSSHGLPDNSPQSRRCIYQTDRAHNTRIGSITMLRGLCKLTWIELKVFLREPLGAIGTIGIPVLVYLGVGRALGRRVSPSSLAESSFMRSGLPV